MAISLSEGAIHDIITKPAEQHPPKPVVQVLGVRKIQANQAGKGTDRYRLILSDGALIHTSAMLATQLNDKVTEGEIEMKAVIRLDKYICNIIQETRKVLIILDCTIVKKACDVPGKIGNPKSSADLNSGQQQAQENGHQKSENGSFGGRQNAPPQRQPMQQQGRGFGGGGKYGSHQPVNRGGDGHKTVFPISGLTPYQNRWTIRARVTSKSGIRTWNNSRGEGRLFNVELVDESGEIRATGFNDAVDKFYDLLEVNKVYYFSKGSLKTANKQYSSLKNDYEMYLNNDTVIEVCTEECDLPTIMYNFVSISDLENINKDTMVDILGVCINAADVTQITTRTTNKQVSKRDVTLVDRSEKSVTATLWGEEAEKFDEHVGKTPVLAIKGAKLSDFGGRSLSILNSSNLRINPLDLKEAMSLRGWYDNTGKNNELQSISNQRYDGGSGKMKYLSQIKNEQLGMGEKPDYLSAKGVCVYLKRENCLYQACPTDECNKKVIMEDDGFRCEKCNKKFPDFKHRLILSAHLADFTSSQWVTCFQESAEMILGHTAKEVGELRDSGNEGAFDQLFANAEFKSYVFKIRAKMETYNEETRLKCSVVGVKPVDYKQDSKRLLEDIQRLMSL
ncbi:replication protein A 70 kDa DNA-binding subunit-like [Actinia tenebrosa]|uniref:Replication protein A subunit n=1 Tax=Actinia tenebrosa TaxID=6105 RepID=A0A6P8J274_ACTTE|nr:replication protein A 70 kDa DNA-binding subunit-like [Actinia tenebrosa]